MYEGDVKTVLFKDELEFLDKIIDQFKSFNPFEDEIPPEIFKSDLTINRMLDFYFKTELPVIKSRIGVKKRELFIGIDDPQHLKLFEIGILNHIYEIEIIGKEYKPHVKKVNDFISQLKQLHQKVDVIKNELDIIKSFYESDEIYKHQHIFAVSGFINVNLQALITGRGAVNEDFKIHGILSPDVVEVIKEKLKISENVNVGAVTLSSYTKRTSGEYVYFVSVLDLNLKPVTTAYLEIKNFIEPSVQFIFTGCKYDKYIKHGIEKVIENLNNILKELEKLGVLVNEKAHI